uniref:ATP synthase F0 subunit 8 n=1 Tax=Monoserius pennarius TaxID=2203294 RepID=A0AA96HRV3_9CNID|nr:ATP synthase F0 subunit 8 [Monoserius pennarius]WNO18774.1 ATP synthase F0 subunit 8 [Monoserius pennarius]
MSQIDITIAFTHFFSFLIVFIIFLFVVSKTILNYFYKFKINIKQEERILTLSSKNNTQTHKNLVNLFLMSNN